MKDRLLRILWVLYCAEKTPPDWHRMGTAIELTVANIMMFVPVNVLMLLDILGYDVWSVPFFQSRYLPLYFIVCLMATWLFSWFINKRSGALYRRFKHIPADELSCRINRAYILNAIPLPLVLLELLLIFYCR